MKLGVGMYRMKLGVAAHERALCRALRAGVSLVDTSPSYGDGDSERLVAKCLADVGAGDAGGADGVKVVTKFGYLQGGDLASHQAVAEGGGGIGAWDDTVKFSPSAWHCISPDFMRAQLGNSMERLEADKVDCLLMHNPEHYLLHRVPAAASASALSSASAAAAASATSASDSTRTDVLEARSQLRERMAETFGALEDEVRAGRIGSYGISSNSFSVPDSDPHFLPYDWILDAAQDAAKAAGNAEHSFSTIELPVNLLELRGLVGCARWAHGHGLRVLASRPLTTFHADGTFRLVDPVVSGTAALDFQRAQALILEHFTPPALEPGARVTAEDEDIAEACAFLRDMIMQIVHLLPGFSTESEYDQFLTEK
jgi:aryl-alcohol dehydrogenase-like predicted oxidoreductase